ncbi:hypothetical protein AK830_g5543 [Neonectria ditissima]|uniref:Uncharacterized protein n=1 Tax=Neonectria ditissima TaxID=78410 RepID=A0A0N8H781_9HYPO|nr:hypothetical protein AK830_g5543 [Neonectria ditissima]
MQPRDHELESIDTLHDGVPDPNPVPPRHGLAKKGFGGGLRYRKTAAILLLFYLPFLLIPWIVTAILMFRPIGFPSYIDPTGAITPSKLKTLKKWHDAARVLRTIAATLGLPIVSALLAHGAVVYTQRRKASQKLNALQMFTLADRTWMDIPRLWNNLITRGNTSTVFLWLATGLIFITALQPMLQSIIINDETKVIVTCKGHPNWTSEATCESDNIHGIVVGHDPDPVYLARCPQLLVIQRAGEKIIDVSEYDTQVSLWLDAALGQETFEAFPDANNNFQAMYPSTYSERPLVPYFASSVPSNTRLGAFRQHAVRMDSRVKCTNVTASEFPKNCRGDAPFETRFSHSELKIDICVEGDSKKTPWTTSRDQQEHSERLWLNVSGTYPNYDYEPSVDEQQYTLKCESTSRRGWFELPSLMNNYTTGPLLKVWPSQDELRRDFNDYDQNGHWADVTYPERTGVPDDDTRTLNWNLPTVPYTMMGANGEYIPTPGPLMTAAMAMFGNMSFFSPATTADEEDYDEIARQLCRQPRMPFSRPWLINDDLAPSSPCYSYDLYDKNPVEITEVLGAFFGRFAYVNSTIEALEVAMFFANEALLTATATTDDYVAGRSIYSNPGERITKPKKSIAALAIISIFIFLQTAGLILLVAFIYSAPTWTGELDADALAQIGAQIKDLGEPRTELRHVSGLVGVLETRHDDDASSLRTVVQESARLALGGEGPISRRTVAAMKPEPATPASRRAPVQRDVYR